MRTPVIVLMLLLVALGACAEGTGERENWSVLLVTLDTTRADSLSCLGGPAGLTPHMDRLASEGVLYTRARTAAPLTHVAHASMFTGLYPLRHSVRDNGTLPLTPAARTLAESAGAAGIRTAAFVASVVLDPSLGLDQGFERYSAPARPAGQDARRLFEVSRPDREVVDEALDWLKQRDRTARFLLWVHLFGPHDPYAAPAEFAALGRSDYHAEVAATDHEVGRLVAALAAEGALANTVVMVVGDHGEALLDHGEQYHGLLCYESTLRVPLILRYADGWRAGSTSAELASVVDVHPTLCAALGLPSPDDIDGLSLWRRALPEDRGVYVESCYGYLHFGWSPLSGWADRHGKYLHSPVPQYFDLQQDPAELTNLAAERDADVERSLRAIDALSRRPRLAAVQGADLDPDLLAGLRQLGYMGAGSGSSMVPDPLEPSDARSPALVEAELIDFRTAKELLETGRFEDALAPLERVLAANPVHPPALEGQAFSLMKLKRHDEAVAPLRQLIAGRHVTAWSHASLGTCMLAAEDPAKALESYLKALEIDPVESVALPQAILLLEAAGRGAEAAALRERQGQPAAPAPR